MDADLIGAYIPARITNAKEDPCALFVIGSQNLSVVERGEEPIDVGKVYGRLCEDVKRSGSSEPRLASARDIGVIATGTSLYRMRSL
ncbi:hypothetical protein COV18_02885 [Candidatus Woesearchaeota archaeon CG10_big_fil_rev_8_21_14_0_10_37_12]|nr:MAG: hypothetical protein COV18_02885 [Candidatus Woesearchaeota archaeon CG10_big_fil_rev_8_21_14_0_10_37_12]